MAKAFDRSTHGDGVRLCALALIALVLGGCSDPVQAPTQPSGAGEGPRPFGPGSSWEYQETRGTQLLRVMDTARQGTSHDVLVVDRRVSGSGGYERHEERWQRASDGALIRYNYTEILQGSTDSLLPTTFGPPCPHLPWPVEDGAYWDGTCMHQTVTGARGEGAYGYRVEGRETVEVPAGTFEAWRILELRSPFKDEPGHKRVWYSDAACGIVREEGVEGAWNRTLTAFSCRP